MAIVCQTDAQWQKLKQAMGNPAWADARFDTLDGRLDHQEEMDEHIQAWAEHTEKYALTDMLQTAGVPAMAVQSSEDRVEHDPQLRARGMYEEASHPILGSWPIQHAPWQMSKTPTPVDRGAPICGEHNIEILCGMLGLTRDEVREGYANNTLWPKSVPVEPYLIEALETEKVG